MVRMDYFWVQWAQWAFFHFSSVASSLSGSFLKDDPPMWHFLLWGLPDVCHIRHFTLLISDPLVDLLHMLDPTMDLQHLDRSSQEKHDLAIRKLYLLSSFCGIGTL